ncbi:flagellar type III secretion system pore protein FliP [Rhodobacteraceae bacterium 2376]|uniref:Flagellar biosynthetic protein FliP n=1 Tax=Rhabdonatronobacter sediminivivens TaxID=2743469 RepID=A0A7Z0KX53_9RHOB|nr:flagellar type III secretion system pore protein FliP [Rhabdonatronobacter sediminivivens]NYS24110.1 flagellar type III secretion system pore protein FliP [Rhabdonatronobacter sediminivivens]
MRRHRAVSTIGPDCIGTAAATRAPTCPPLPARPVLWLLCALAAFCLGALPAQAQEISLNFGEDGALAVRSIQLIVLITLLSIAPGVLIMLTCFPFIVTVLALLRQAIGLQQSPPNMLIVSLSLFLTWFVMEPVFLAAWEAGVVPLNDGTLALEEAIPRALEPFRLFMVARIDPATYDALAALRPDPVGALDAEAPLSVLIPGFMLSEIARAFEIGFLIFLPFLIIDLVVAAVLMSMGMMMVPPAVVALPFKLSFFVIADGWTLISEALVRSYF